MRPLLKAASDLFKGVTADSTTAQAEALSARHARYAELLKHCAERLKGQTAPASLPLAFKLAQGKDCAELSHVELVSARFENRLYPLDVPEETFARMWVERLASGEYVALLALNGGKLAGFVAFKGPVKEGYISALYILPLYFRKGVGRSLMELAALFCVSEGGKSLTLKVEPLNYGAISFYQSLNFRPRAVKSSHLIVFQKELLPC